MTDRRDPEAEELRERLDELEATLTKLRAELDDERAPRDIRGRPDDDRRPPRPPRIREVLRFTEEYTIPTLISVLETNIRLLRLGGAALRALDPERSVAGADAADGAVRRALDAGRGFSTDRLAEGLDDLNDALTGTEAPNPEARELLNEAETLSTEIQERLRESKSGAGREHESERGTDRSRSDRVDGDSDDTVHIDVTDASGDAERDGSDAGDDTPEPDVDAELDSIRDEIRGPGEKSNDADEPSEDTAGSADGVDEPSEDTAGSADGVDDTVSE